MIHRQEMLKGILGAAVVIALLNLHVSSSYFRYESVTSVATTKTTLTTQAEPQQLQELQHLLKSPDPPRTEKENEYDGIRTRVFTPWNGTWQFPCLRPESGLTLETVKALPANDGFLHLKCAKTGGSTTGGVHLRIARNMARAKNRIFPANYSYMEGIPMCRVRYNHARATALRLSERDPKRSFVWTVVRDPTKRAISHVFYFHVTREGMDPNNSSEFQRIVKEAWVQRHYFHFLSDRPISSEIFSNNLTAERIELNRVMGMYDFIGVTERMDESIVALQLLLGLTTRDVLHLDAKRTGAMDDGTGPNGCCRIKKSELTKEMQTYFHNPKGKWQRINRIQTAFHRAVNASLDQTIDGLGRTRFEDALHIFRHAQSKVSKRCSDEEYIPCPAWRVGLSPLDACIDKDMGCGLDCIDRVADELGLPEYVYHLEENKL